MKEFVTKFLIMVGIATLVVVVWQGLEKFIMGTITPRSVDNVIGMILTWSLYINYLKWTKEDKIV